MAIVLGVMILIHEWGHYAAAKYFRVRVEVFSIGFGKRLLGFRRGETDYRISAIPLGGYVKMSGENPMDERTDDPGEFLNHPRWQRFIIAIAGPFMNVVLAVGLLTVVYMVHYEYPAFIDQPGVIAYVKTDSPAAQAGLQPGDRIVKIGGVQNPTWEAIGLNERFRYYRYDPGQKFRPHFDGSFDRTYAEKSLLTFMVYLNEGFAGGWTRFHTDRERFVAPEAGKALVFWHQQLHEGMPVESGRKYVLRTDVMYRRQSR